jgi:hypothetical protein
MVAPKGGAPLRLGSPGDGGGGSLKAIAEDAAIASITIIRATTVDNKSMRRRIMRYLLSLEGGADEPRLTLHNEDSVTVVGAAR